MSQRCRPMFYVQPEDGAVSFERNPECEERGDFHETIDAGEFDFALAHTMAFMVLLNDKFEEIGEYEEHFMKEAKRVFKSFSKWQDDTSHIPFEYDWQEYDSPYNPIANIAILANEINVCKDVANDWLVDEAFEELGIPIYTENLSKEDREKVSDLIFYWHGEWFHSEEGKEWLAKKKIELGQS